MTNVAISVYLVLMMLYCPADTVFDLVTSSCDDKIHFYCREKDDERCDIRVSGSNDAILSSGHRLRLGDVIL